MGFLAGVLFFITIGCMMISGTKDDEHAVRMTRFAIAFGAATILTTIATYI